jgi:hypothetical protein
MNHPHDQSQAYDAYDAATDTAAPETDIPSVPVEVVGPVETIERPALSVSTEQITVAAGVPVRLVGAVPERESVLIKASGGQMWVGNQTVTTGSGYMLNDGESITLTARCSLYAVTTAPVTAYIIAQHRTGSLA